MEPQSPNNSSKPEILSEIQVINIGLEQFFNSLKEQEIQVLHVSWSPPAGGDQEVIDLLNALL